MKTQIILLLVAILATITQSAPISATQLPSSSSSISLEKKSTTYSVVAGDTGDAIAVSCGITFAELSVANPGVDWYELQVGQVLQIPSAPSASTNSAANTAAGATASSSATAATASSSATDVSLAEPTITSTSQVSGTLAVPSVTGQDGKGFLPDTYTFHTGDGSPSAGWPTLTDWASFSFMWTANAAVIGQNCGAFNVASNTAAETAQILAAIEAVAAASRLDHRFILATIMQESGGCVRVPTTNYGVRNPGLMQDHDGVGTCNDGGEVKDPCPEAEIFQMVEDGAMGTAAGDGGVQVLEQAVAEGGVGAQAFYMAARIYNSGSIVGSDLGAGVATHCYASDIANRLTGWVSAVSTCTLDD